MSHRCLLPTLLLAGVLLLANSCTGLNIRLGTVPEKPLKEFTLEGKGRGKVLVIPVVGFLSDIPKKGLVEQRPSMVQEIVSRLRRAEKDEEVKAVLLEINSPGGSITASDIIYHEIVDFKAKTGARVVAALMDVAASGGYYIALPADRIVAHPTTITGSVGVILVQPKVTGLMDKLGIAVEVNKSGKEKDIGSPFRPSTVEEQRIMQGLTDTMGGRFLGLVARHRQLRPEALAKVGSARIYLADEALQLKLIDSVGYLEDALGQAKALAGFPEDARVVVYRRTKYVDDNVYNTSLAASTGALTPLIEMSLPDIIPPLTPGFYYLWLPGGAGN